MTRWTSLAALPALLLILTACPTYESMKLAVQPKAKTFTLTYMGIGTSDPDDADEDFRKVLTTVFDEEEDGIEVTSSSLEEVGGKLVGEVSGTYRTLEDLGIYKHDRKSPYLFCADGKYGQGIGETNGTAVPTHTDCVVWDRKAKDLRVTLDLGESEGATSLLPQFRAWVEAGRPAPEKKADE